MTSTQQLPGVPGGIGLDVDGYAEFLAKNYLGEYIRAGGGAVRLVVTGDDEVAARWHRRLAAISDGEGYYCVSIDAASTRVHLLHEVFLAMPRQIDWLAPAGAVVQAVYRETGFPADDGAIELSALGRRSRRSPARSSSAARSSRSSGGGRPRTAAGSMNGSRRRSRSSRRSGKMTRTLRTNSCASGPGTS